MESVVEEENSLKERFPRYSTICCTVTAHRSYGLIVEIDEEFRGYIDLGHIAPTSTSGENWPRMGAEIRALVLGVTHDGRVRLDIRRDDLELADHAVDLPDAMSRWTAARHAEPGNTMAQRRFYESPDAAILLSWLVAGGGRGTSIDSVWGLVDDAPEEIRREVAKSLTRSALHGDPGLYPNMATLYTACGMDLSLDILNRLLTEESPSPEDLTALAASVTDRRILNVLKRWALDSADAALQKVGERLTTRTLGDGVT
ncbi:hypothetical protein [Streptomyces sp. NPDC051576]|uniref:hypothetical protein n=1 Tax=Streptomyces sp. NPDC051576 TaxID=3155803 RepID=UPI00342FBEF7